MQTFDVTGMSCDHCVRTVMGAIRDVDPAAKVSVDLESGRVTVKDEKALPDRLAAAITDAGYTVTSR